VVFEQSYDHYQTQETALDALSTSHRGNYSYMLHSVPTMSNHTLKDFIDDLSDRAEYLFLTTLEADYYEKFDSKLEVFCDMVPTSQT
jgi:Spherulation-specific family 4